jgi:hypothetical protein
MKIIGIKEVEDCFDRSMFREIELDRPVSYRFIEFIGKTGELEYYHEFPRPFFKVTVPFKYTLKGIEGSSSVRLLLKSDFDAVLREFCETVESYPE